MKEMYEMYENLKAKEKTEDLTKCEQETLNAIWIAIDEYERRAIEDLF